MRTLFRRGARVARGFTLVELMVVVIIVGVLAAVATPVYMSNTRRAKLGEALATMGTMRAAENVYNTEFARFLPVASPNLTNEPNAAAPGLGINVDSNHYFDKACFSVTIDSSGLYTITCDGSLAISAPQRNEIVDFRAELRTNGQSRRSFDSGRNWTNWE
jgi:prepilin-type N-terminal cleavage/methylation domain-containing protein